MRIAILTFHRANNCGAMLQAWALRRVLLEMGHKVDFPDCNFVGNYDQWFYHLRRIPKSKRGLSRIRSFVGRLYLDARLLLGARPQAKPYARFRRRYLPERHCDPSEFEKYYDIIIIGSDQVWNIDLMKEDAPLFLGETIPESIPLVAYAASSGDVLLKEQNRLRLTKALARFSALSVREELARKQLAFDIGKEMPIVLDPTLLVKRNDMDELSAPQMEFEPYLYVYTVWATEYIISVATELARRLNLKLVMTVVVPSDEQKKDPRFILDVTPDKMVSYIKHAEYVLAASFHGTSLSIIYRKNFLSLRDKVDVAESRPESLLRRFGMAERLINPSVSIEDAERRILRPLPDFDEAIELESARSRGWIKNAVEFCS